MRERRIRVYADTSVFGGAFDPEFRRASRAFFEQVRQGRFTLVISPVLRREAMNAPPWVRDLYEELLPLAEGLEVDQEVVRLADAYVAAGIVPPLFYDDALHVALATVSGCTAIVSWNFKHVVHLGKIPLYNALNATNGYRPIEIRSPREVIAYENPDA